MEQNILRQYRGRNPIVRVPDGVTAIGTGAFLGNNELRRVILPDSVTAICDSAFFACRSLTELVLGRGVTSIARYAFWGCGQLSRVTIHAGITHLHKEAFLGCDRLPISYHHGCAYLGSENQPYHTLFCMDGWHGSPDRIHPDAQNAPLNLLSSDRTRTRLYLPARLVPTEHARLCALAALGYLSTTDYPYTAEDRAFYHAYILDHMADLLPDILSDQTLLRTLLSHRLVTTACYDAILERASELADGMISAFLLDWGNRHADAINAIREASFSSLLEEDPNSPTACAKLWEWKRTRGKGCLSITAYKGTDACPSLPATIGAMRVTAIARYALSPKNLESLPARRSFLCDILTVVTIPNGVERIGDYAFAECASLSEITIPDTVVRIGHAAFRGCPKLTIYGSAGSPAETYAAEHGLPFVAV